jgi:uncharacterized protein
MAAITERKKMALAELWRRYRVERLYVFRPAVLGQSDAQCSDPDFLVRFADRALTRKCADRFLQFAEALERLFDRPIHLLTEESIGNCRFRREMGPTQQLAFALSHESGPNRDCGLADGLDLDT